MIPEITWTQERPEHGDHDVITIKVPHAVLAQQLDDPWERALLYELGRGDASVADKLLGLHVLAHHWERRLTDG